MPLSCKEAPVPDYNPLDLGSYCNAGITVYGAEAQPPTGSVLLRGFPFLIGGATPDPQRCLIGLGALEGPLTVPVGAVARHVLFAHALLDSRILKGETVGSVVAQYSIRYADGEIVQIPIRE